MGYIFISQPDYFGCPDVLLYSGTDRFCYKLDKVLLKRMVVYSFPVLILRLVGILNQTVDKMIYPFLFEDRQEGWCNWVSMQQPVRLRW